VPDPIAYAAAQVAPGKLLVVDRGNNSLKLVGLPSAKWERAKWERAKWERG
jgi:hypothetical protein